MSKATDQILQTFCLEMKGVIIEGEPWHSARVQINYRFWNIIFDNYSNYSTSGGASYQQTFTRVVASFKNTHNLCITITRSNIFKSMAKVFGSQDVAIGFDDFDKKFIIKANHAKEVQQFLCNDKIRELISIQDYVHLTITDCQGYYGDPHPAGITDLVFIADKPITNLHELKSLYELFCVCLDQLEKIGTATPNFASH
jgi:hypothetical protein